MEGAEECDDRGPAGRMARQLDRTFDRFGPRVRQEHALLARPGRELREPLAQRRKAFVVEVAAADMKEARGGVLDRLHDLRMPIARGGDGDACHEVEEPIAVDVLDDGAFAARHGERILLGIRCRGKAVLPVHDGARFWPWRRHHDTRVVSHQSVTFFSVALSAAVNRLTISSISSSVMIKGGAIKAASPLVPSACPTLGQTVIPAAIAASAKRSANFAERGSGARLALSSTNSMPASRPRPRTSPTCGKSVSGRSRSCRTLPILAQRSTRLCFFK